MRDGQEWGIALLFSVEPTDRALAGWHGSKSCVRYLELLAEDAEQRAIASKPTERITIHDSE